MIGAASSTVVSHNSLYTNDVGIYTDTGVTIDHNDVASRDFGIATDYRERGAGRSQLDDRRHLRDLGVRRNRHLQPQLGERQLGRRSLVGRHRHAQLQPQQLRYGIAQQSDLGLPLAAVAHQRDHRARPAGAPGRGLQLAPTSVIRTRATIASRAHPAPFADWATPHPALIPHEAPGSSRRYPPIPARPRAKDPALAGNPRRFPPSPQAP